MNNQFISAIVNIPAVFEMQNQVLLLQSPESQQHQGQHYTVLGMIKIK